MMQQGFAWHVAIDIRVWYAVFCSVLQRMQLCFVVCFLVCDMTVLVSL